MSRAFEEVESLYALRQHMPLICNRDVSAPSLTGFGNMVRSQTGFERCKSQSSYLAYRKRIVAEHFIQEPVVV